MSNNKSFFQKISDSITSIFPFNSTAKELPNISQVSFEKHLSPIRYPLNRRVASEAFGKEDDEIKHKRAKLHHDPLSLPMSRIIKQPVHQNPEKILSYGNHFSDAASDFSDVSNVSVSTSGVSSLHPRSTKRMNFGHNDEAVAMQSTIKTPNNLNLSQKLFSPVLQKSFKDSDGFMSSPARKILEKLDRLTTPITAADRLSSIAQKERFVSKTRAIVQETSYSPYGRPIPPTIAKRPLPTKAVTVSASSIGSCGPIRRKATQRVKKLGYTDDIDLDSESLCHNTKVDLPKLVSSKQVDFTNRLPLLKKSQSTSTNDDDSTLFISPRQRRESSPALEFTFRSPTTINDEDYRSESAVAISPPRPSYQFKSKIPDEEIAQYRKQRTLLEKCQSPPTGLWRCDTCFKENDNYSNKCSNCENILKKPAQKSTPKLEEKKIAEEPVKVSPIVVEVPKPETKVSLFSSNADQPKVSSLSTPIIFSSLASVAKPPIDVSVPPPSLFGFGSTVVPPIVPTTEFNLSVPPPVVFGSIPVSKPAIINTSVPPPFADVPPIGKPLAPAVPFLFGQATTDSPVSTFQLPIAATSPLATSQPVTVTPAASSMFVFNNPASSKVDSNHKPFSFGTESTAVSTKPFSFNKDSTTEAPKPFSFGAESTAVSTKPFAFATESTAVSTKPFSFNKESTTETPKPFSFGDNKPVSTAESNSHSGSSLFSGGFSMPNGSIFGSSKPQLPAAVSSAAPVDTAKPSTGFSFLNTISSSSASGTQQPFSFLSNTNNSGNNNPITNSFGNAAILPSSAAATFNAPVMFNASAAMGSAPAGGFNFTNTNSIAAVGDSNNPFEFKSGTNAAGATALNRRLLKVRRKNK